MMQPGGVQNRCIMTIKSHCHSGYHCIVALLIISSAVWNIIITTGTCSMQIAVVDPQ